MTITAKSHTVVNFTVKVPDGVGPGEYNACITLQDTQNYAATKGAGIQLGFRIAIRLAVQVPGKVIKKLTIDAVQTNRQQNGTYSATPVAHNEGNVSLDVQGRAQLFDVFGRKSEVVEANYPIMPGSEMKWAYGFKPIFWGGMYKAKVSLAYNANAGDGLGVEGATNSRKKISATSGYFFVVPAPKAIAIELLVLLIPLFAWVGYIRKRRLGKKLRNKWSTYIVQPGDELVRLAEDHGIRWKQLARVNHVKAPYMLRPGQSILLPVMKDKQIKKKNWVVDEAPLVSDAQYNEAYTPAASEAAALPSRPAANSSQTIVKYVVMAPPRQTDKKRKNKYDWAQPALYYADSEETARAAVGAKPRKKTTNTRKSANSKKA